MLKKLDLNKNPDERVDVECGECIRSTKHLILASADLTISESTESDCSVWCCWSSYQLVQCQGCESVSFRRLYQTSDDVGVQTDHNKWKDDVYVDVFPTPSKGRKLLSDEHLLPEQVERIYSESIRALNAKQTVLCGIGIRALIETVCKDKNANGRNLHDKIEDLSSQNVLTRAGADILHQIRTLGNDAAHEVKSHSPQQLDLAMDVVEHLLQSVYILPFHAKRTFKQTT